MAVNDGTHTTVSTRIRKNGDQDPQLAKAIEKPRRPKVAMQLDSFTGDGDEGETTGNTTRTEFQQTLAVFGARM